MIADQAGQGDQPELDLQADYGWMHVMRARILKGLLSDIGETAWAVYTVIKAHANHQSGLASPSQERIGRLIGKSAETVSRATAVLERAGLLEKHKHGRQTTYTLMEAAPLMDRKTGLPQGSADFAYVPAAFGAQLQAIRSFVADGLPPGRGITLHLNINLVQQRDNGSVTINNLSLDSPLDQRFDMRELVQKLKLLN